MKALNRLFRRFGNFAARRNQAQRFREEMEDHVARQTEENIRAGMTPQEARRQALLRFGPAEAISETYHAEQGLPGLETLVQDCRYGVRMLRRSPVFTVVAVLTLALGIGANAAIFTLVHALMLKKLPVADPHSLVRLGNNNDCCVGSAFRSSGEVSMFTTDTYEFLKKNNSEFEELAAMQAGFAYRPVVVRREGAQETPRSVMGEFVSGNYFRTFGLKPLTGRLLQDEDDVAGAPMAAVMSYQTWKNSFDRDPSVVGATMYVNTKPVTVVGVAPEEFYGDRLLSTPPDFYLPIETMPPIANATYVHQSEQQWLYIIGRLKPGVSRVAAQQIVSELLRQQLVTTKRFSTKEGRERARKAHVVLTEGGGGIQTLQEQYDSHLRMLMWASGLVLLIACANIANLLLVRGMARKAEINVRTALGAKRGRILRQMLTESVLLASIGGAVGLAVAYLGTRMLLVLAFPGAEHVPIHAAPSSAVLAFAFGLSLVTGILFGVAPAWIAANTQPAEALHGGRRTVVGGATLLQRALVVLQAGLSLVLLVGAGLFMQSLGKLQHIDLKLSSENRYMVHINPQTAGYSQTGLAALYRTLEDRFHQVPGVEKVGLASYTPMEDNNNGFSVVVQGKPDPNKIVSVVRVSPEYFDSVGTRLVMGRAIGVQDVPGSTTVAVVNRTFVDKLFQPGENPIGQHFGGGSESANDYEIVGVVEDTAYSDARLKDHLMCFTALLQRPASDDSPIEHDEGLYIGAIVLQTSRPVPDMETIARKTLAAINPNLSVVKFQSFDAQISDRFAEDRMLTRLTTMFGALALLLATLGLYGVTAYGVARRTSEIGIRMALGAHRGGVMTMVVRGAMLQALIGLAIGVPAALLCVRFVASQLYEVKGVDPSVLAGAVVTLGVAASVAALIPARRAATIDPARALRTE